MRNDATALTRSGWVTVTDAPHWLELDWRASPAPGANNGAGAWSIDGATQTGLSGVDNDTRRIDGVRLGAVTGPDAGISGTLFVDGFDSRRASALGPTAGPRTTAITDTDDPLRGRSRGGEGARPLRQTGPPAEGRLGGWRTLVRATPGQIPPASGSPIG